ncbi:MAG: hypothetical protein M3134_08935 [Actinomycetota bacterium]|nr:hypothetical protein [Actinomycetota bacterium]
MSIDPHPDPGWAPALKYALPGAARPAEGVGAITVLRGLFIALAGAPLTMLFVMAFIFEEVGSPDLPLAAVVVAVGLGGVVAASWTRSRPLEGNDEAEVAGSYRTLFFLGFALAEAALLVSFVLAFVADGLWPFVMALPLYLLAMALIAPSRSNLDKREAQLRGGGSTISLRGALTKPIVGLPRPGPSSGSTWSHSIPHNRSSEGVAAESSRRGGLKTPRARPGARDPRRKRRTEGRPAPALG